MPQITKQRVLERTRELLADAYPLLIAAQNEANKKQPDMDKLYDLVSDLTDPVIDAADVLSNFKRLNKVLDEGANTTEGKS